jgi:hypothetical protein
MKNKVINLFDKPKNIIPNQGESYSKLVEKFLEPFVKDFKDVEFYEDIFESAIFAWNAANMKLLIPNEENEPVFNSLDSNEVNVNLLKRMIDYKISHFKNYTNFIVDYELVETTGDPILRITSQGQDDYLKAMLENFDQEDEEGNENNL